MAPSARDTLDLSNTSSNQRATQQLVPWLRSHDVPVIEAGDAHVWIRPGMISFLLEPKVTDGGLDRIVVHTFFKAKRSARRQNVVDLAQKLTAQYNIGGFWVTDANDLAFQTHITFVDELGWPEVRSFLDWLEVSVFQSMMLSDEARTLLE